MSKWWIALLTIIGLTFSNFLYQKLKKGSLEIALRISYFQAVAIFIFAVNLPK